MLTEWFRFDWHGHRRGSLQFTILYNPETNKTEYDAICFHNVNEYVPQPVPVENSNQTSTLRQIICEIFQNNGAVGDAYERYCRSLKDEGSLTQNHLLDFAFSEFEWNGDQDHLETIMNMTFQDSLLCRK